MKSKVFAIAATLAVTFAVIAFAANQPSLTQRDVRDPRRLQKILNDRLPDGVNSTGVAEIGDNKYINWTIEHGVITAWAVTPD